MYAVDKQQEYTSCYKVLSLNMLNCCCCSIAMYRAQMTALVATGSLAECQCMPSQSVSRRQILTDRHRRHLFFLPKASNFLVWTGYFKEDTGVNCLICISADSISYIFFTVVFSCCQFYNWMYFSSQMSLILLYNNAMAQKHHNCIMSS